MTKKIGKPPKVITVEIVRPLTRDFMLIDPMRNWVVNGSRFDLSAADVIAYCTEQGPTA